MRFVSLFTGIGGLDLGLERAGWTCVAQVELDEFCRAVLAKHWPDVPRFADVRDVRGSELPAADALVGGFPCQPVSVAGKRGGHGDIRWLWPEFFRLVREMRPARVVIENVPGLRTLGADGVLADLESEGYSCWPLVVGADDVGAPHRRKRVFVVADAAAGGLERRARGGRQEEHRPQYVGDGMADSLGDPLRDVEQRGPGRRPRGVRDEGEAVARGDDAALADADRSGRGERRGAESTRPELGAAECGGAVADTDQRGLGEPGRARQPEGRRQHTHEADAGRLADTDGGRCGGEREPEPRRVEGAPGNEPDGRDRGRAEGADEDEGRPESGLGRGADGLPARMVRRWPAPPGPQHEDEPPRTIPSGSANLLFVADAQGKGFPAGRRARLKALGNAVVPAVAEEIARAMESIR